MKMLKILAIIGVIVGFYLVFAKSGAEPAAQTSAAYAAAEPAVASSVGDSTPQDDAKPVARVDPAQQSWQASADAQIGTWSRWHTNHFKDASGVPMVAIWARDVNYVQNFLSNSYAIGYHEGTEAQKDFMTGFDGETSIPRFSIMYGGGTIKAAINDPNATFRYNLDGSLSISFIFHLKDGKTVYRNLPAYMGQDGRAVMLQEETLAAMDFIMVSETVEVNVPSYVEGGKRYAFDCSTFSAKGIIDLKE